MLWQKPVRFHLTVILILCLGGTGALWWLVTRHPTSSLKHWLGCWLLVVNLVTLGYYGLDKLLSTRLLLQWWRVPETVLHTLSALGGSPAALLAMWLLRHKTIKNSFRILFWGIVILQTALAVSIVKLLWWD